MYNHKSKRYLLLLVFFIFINTSLQAQYYSTALGLNGTSLKTSLHNIIKNHQAQAWPLWSYFYTTDDRNGNQVWDMYSDVPNGTPPYTFILGTNQCGSYTQEGSCYNHEHTWPSTYFNDATPMKTDLFHVMPTDGWVNNKRSNFPYGKVNNANWTSQNGCKLGVTSSYTQFQTSNPNHWGFEPIDSFKGDVARNYFYMSTRYESEDAGWVNWEMATGATLTTDAINLLLQWHHNDPVSQKEKDRNEAIYLIQGNRNPFIDYPEFADCIWGTGDCTALSIQTVDNKKNKLFAIFPNPTSNQLSIKCLQTNLPIMKINVLDLLGKKMDVTQSFLYNELIIVDIQALCKGNYVVQIFTEKGIVNQLFSKN